MNDFGTMSLQERHEALQADLARTRSELATALASREQAQRANEAAHAKLLPVMRAVRRWAEKHRPVRCCKECEALFQIAEGRGEGDAELEAARALADSVTAYFNRRGVAQALRDGNEDIAAMAEALANYGAVEQKARAE